MYNIPFYWNRFKSENFYEAFVYLKKHPLIKEFFPSMLHIDVTMTNPTSNSDNNSNHQDTGVRVLLSITPCVNSLSKEADIINESFSISSEGYTFEEAIQRLAIEVRKLSTSIENNDP